MGEVTILGPSCTRPPQIGEGSGGNVACHGLGESQKIKGVEHRTYKSGVHENMHPIGVQNGV